MAMRRAFAVYKHAAALAFLLGVLCPSVSAQGFLRLRAPSLEVFGGYSYMRFDSKQLGFSGQDNLNGGNVEIAIPNIYNGIGFAVDASGHFSSEWKEFNFMFGPQYTYEVKSLRIFGHGLVGKARTRLRMPGTSQIEPSSLGDAVALGGGLELPWKGKLALRPIQADYMITGAYGDKFHNVRISTGLTYTFGKH
jgi:hypothetical protein